jgi:DNA-binding NarL/FixJ family response regulator
MQLTGTTPTITQARRIRVGIADDHPIFLDGLCRLLSMEEDIEVVARAKDGHEALRIVQEYKPDILLLDLQMPGRNGIETLRDLKALSAPTRVVLLTASEDRERFVEAVRYGSAGVVSKQSATDFLVQSIRRVHAGDVCLDDETTAAVVRQLRNPQPLITPPPKRHLPDAGRPAASEGIGTLTPRERAVVQLLVQGLRNRDIADRLFLSEQTVKNHLNSIFGKLQVSDRLELALYAIHHGIQQPQ